MPISRTCDYCDKPFSCLPSQSKRFCSHACYSANKRVRVTRTCEQCGQSFDTIPAYLRKGPVRFCSRDCYWLSNPVKGAKHKRWKGGTRTLTCAGCGSDFERPLTWAKHKGR